jgi:hypothetical protein
VSPKTKAKIWADEYVDFGALLSPAPAREKYSLSLAPAQDGSSSQPHVTLEPCQPSKRISTINQWQSAFNTFVAIYATKYSRATPKLMKYCEIVRDISSKPGDWAYYDEQFRLIRQSAPDRFPWDVVHWELWLRAVTTFRAKPQTASDNKTTMRSRPRQSFPKGNCWTFNAGKYCSGCRFEHKCFKCGAKHAASQCAASGTQQHVTPRNGPTTALSNSKEQASHPRKSGQT